jgi:hypothetical protein
MGDIVQCRSRPPPPQRQGSAGSGSTVEASMNPTIQETLETLALVEFSIEDLLTELRSIAGVRQLSADTEIEELCQ